MKNFYWLSLIIKLLQISISQSLSFQIVWTGLEILIQLKTLIYLLPFLILGGLVFDAIFTGFCSSSPSEDDEYPLAAAAGMPDSARCNLNIPMHEPTSLTTSSCGARLTSQPLTASKQSPERSPALSAELWGTTQLKMHGACPDMVNPNPCCPRTSLATLKAGGVECEVIGGEKGLARAFFWRLDACIMNN